MYCIGSPRRNRESFFFFFIPRWLLLESKRQYMYVYRKRWISINLDLKQERWWWWWWWWVALNVHESKEGITSGPQFYIVLWRARSNARGWEEAMGDWVLLYPAKQRLPEPKHLKDMDLQLLNALSCTHCRWVVSLEWSVCSVSYDLEWGALHPSLLVYCTYNAYGAGPGCSNTLADTVGRETDLQYATMKELRCDSSDQKLTPCRLIDRWGLSRYIECSMYSMWGCLHSTPSFTVLSNAEDVTRFSIERESRKGRMVWVNVFLHYHSAS